jgi:site-specific DNA-methyltransferase (adenine-specific)
MSGKLPEPYYKDESATIYCGDCRKILPVLPKVDLVLTDPPYGINYTPHLKGGRSNEKHWNIKHVTKIAGDDTPFDPAPWIDKPCILWGANHYASKLPDSGGWLVFDKQRTAATSKGFVASDAELAWTNLFSVTRLFSHLWNGLCRGSEVGEHYHVMQKPTELMRWCIGFAPDAQTILDPFMGSGTTLRAAKDLGRRAIGIEINESYCRIAVERLRQEVLAL